ncbi:MAG: hypothetical protein ABI233_00765 [Chthoniobacterales bacterium]
MPKEVFRTLDKFDGANWSAVQRPEIAHWKSHGDQVQVALLLGVVVAEGFVSMEAKDSTELRDLSNSLRSLARGLGVGQAALRRSRSITEAAERGDWRAARKEWDGVLFDFEQGMIDLKSEPISQLVSLGGWLRGTQALCALLLQDYSPERAQLLRQPVMVAHLEKQLLEMPPEIRSSPMVAKMVEGIGRIRRLVQDEKGPLAKQTVVEIGSICKGLVEISSQRPRAE